MRKTFLNENNYSDKQLHTRLESLGVPLQRHNVCFVFKRWVMTIQKSKKINVKTLNENCGYYTDVH